MSTNNDRKLPMRVKLGYPLMNVAPTLQMLIQMYFLLMSTPITWESVEQQPLLSS